MTLDERRAAMHAILQRHAQPHDTYIGLGAIGNEETVPLLLERFRQDAGTAGPPAPVEVRPPSPPDDDPLRFMSGLFIRGRSTVAAFSCVHHHLVEALANTTNTNQGLYYPAWEAWWRENAGLSRDEWVAKGFAAAGLHVADPIDDRVALELMAHVGGPRGHLQFNALHLLARPAADRRRGWLRAAVEDAAAVRRLGAIERVGHEDLLRRLARDSDADVSREALTVLNDRLRDAAEAGAPARRMLTSRRSFALHWVVDTPAGARAGFADDVVAFEASTVRVRWRRAVGRTTHGVAVAGRLIVGSSEGDLTGLDANGRVIWRAPGTGAPDQVGRLIAVGEGVAVVRNTRIEFWEPASGTLRWRVDVGAHIYDATASGDVLYVGTARGLERIADGRVDAMRPLGPAIGVSSGPAGVCVTQSKAVGCYDPITLESRWSRENPPDGTWGSHVAPLQVGDGILLLSREWLTMHRAADGAPLWSMQSGQFAHGFVATPFGLFVRNDRYRAELLDLATGEVRAAWREPAVGRLGVVGSTGIIGGMSGSTWLVDLAAAVGVR
jgi:outer membrane protein assembly factor BamB